MKAFPFFFLSPLFFCFHSLSHTFAYRLGILPNHMFKLQCYLIMIPVWSYGFFSISFLNGCTMAYGNSWARDGIQAEAVALSQLQQCWIL